MKNRPQKCCHPDCQSCPYADCRWDAISAKDYVHSANFDKIAETENMPYEKRHDKEIQHRYNHSQKGKETREKYRESEAYRESQTKYRKSEKGIVANRKRSSQYYQRKSEEIGRPISTVRQHFKKYGVDMGRGEFIGTVFSDGRISIPKRFRDQIGLNEGEKFAVYVDRNKKIVIIGLDSARKITKKNLDKLEKYESGK